VLAAAIADVLGANPDPLVGGGVGDHALDESSVLRLDAAPPLELGAHVREPRRERVADALELRDPEQARPAGGADAPLDLRARGRREQLRELALHPRDLRPQLATGRPQILRRAAGDPPSRWSLLQ